MRVACAPMSKTCAPTLIALVALFACATAQPASGQTDLPLNAAPRLDLDETFAYGNIEESLPNPSTPTAPTPPPAGDIDYEPLGFSQPVDRLAEVVYPYRRASHGWFHDRYSPHEAAVADNYSSHDGDDCGCSNVCTGDCLDAVCQDCPHHGLYAFVGYDAWRGLPDGNWGNWGISSGVNYGTRLGEFSEMTGIGFQIGGSAGAYNWAGTDYRTQNNDQAQPQGFITYGLFRKASEDSRWNAAVVQDWMINANYGVFAQNPTLSQIRIQLGYTLNAWNEVGVWGAWRCLDASRDVPGFGTIKWRSVNQLNAYWHHKWSENGVDTWLWAGAPENNRLEGDGSLGDYLVGALANAPLSDRVALYSMVSYMHQSARAGFIGSTEDAWNFTVGLQFFPGYSARSRTVAGRCWMPQLPVANNGYFLVDTNGVF